jgi:serine/threonine protein kinase
LYNLVTGTLPFEADNIYLLFQAIGKGVYTIPDDIEPHLTSFLRGLLHVDKISRLTIERIKQHDWFRRRPPRTFDFLPFPPLAINRFQTFTMYDYLTELHQASTDVDDDDAPDDHQQQQQPPQATKKSSSSIAVVQSPHDTHPSQVAEQRARRRGRSALNCGCSRTSNSGDDLHQTNKQTSAQHRICTLS